MSYYVPLTISYEIVGITISYLIPRTGSTIVTETRDVISPSLTVCLSLSLPPRPELVVSLIHQQCEKWEPIVSFFMAQLRQSEARVDVIEL